MGKIGFGGFFLGTIFGFSFAAVFASLMIMYSFNQRIRVFLPVLVGLMFNIHDYLKLNI